MYYTDGYRSWHIADYDSYLARSRSIGKPNNKNDTTYSLGATTGRGRTPFRKGSITISY